MTGALDPIVQRRRLITMVIIDVICVVIAVAAITGHMMTHQTWLLGLFATAMAAGFAAQFWFFIGFARAGRP